MGGAAWLSIFGFGKASTRKHIRPAVAGRPRSNATQGKKRRHPEGKSTSRRLAALLIPYRPARVCSSLAPCQPPQIALARSPPIYEMASQPQAHSYCYHWFVGSALEKRPEREKLTRRIQAAAGPWKSRHVACQASEPIES